ncbi:cyclophilin, putative [Theileria annulata]|uniref:Peptidyl-prolyl cis-trans isomerase n=1 Tax=Theileria annulata TaxID=5874 RepID=Q4UIU2_THEAN|nr:cyclophilin, putative [Theileria annulata]CAI72997.1 cyclophilin, putative [Theileria annulata]|eukprot:XP_953675.1 cyclophilin, putative [Theileria annulata]
MNKVPNPRVFFDISIAGRRAGRMIFELFMDKLPYTAENFRCLCTAVYRGNWTRILSPAKVVQEHTHTSHCYRICEINNLINQFNRCAKEVILIPGTLTEENLFMDNICVTSPIHTCTPKEVIVTIYLSSGVLGMCKTRFKNSNSSQFYITFKPCSFLDNKMVVFGHLEYGEDVLDMIEKQGTMVGKTKKKVNIYNCGEIPIETIYDPRIKNEVTEAKYIARTDIERPLFNEKMYNLEQSYKTIIPEEVYKRAHFNF